MTEAAAPLLDPRAGEYVQIWAESFSQVMGQVAGSAIPCVVRVEAPAGLIPAAADDLWVLVTSSGALRGEISLRLSPPTVLRLAQTFMGEPPAPEAALTQDHRDAVEELLRQISGFVSTAAKPRWGDLQLHVELAAAGPSWPLAETLWLQSGDEEVGGTTSGMMLEFGFSAALLAELRAEKVEAVKSPEEASVSTVAADLGPGTGALDLLMDVQLGVSMRFGARQLLLREVLELSPGAVVELDRRVQEPVDLLLDGKLVARGEVVIIDGNYGLRVTDVAPLTAQVGRQER
jgi:flagellar motor switch protein FliN/FliY